MKQTLLSLFFVVLCSGTVFGAPGIHEVVTKSPPTPYALQGLLTMPVEGDQFVNQGGTMGDIQLIYSMPGLPPSRLSSEVKSPIVAIDVKLIPRRESGFNPGPDEVYLARGLRATGEKLGQIQANFVPPLSACGDFRLQVVESQLLENAVVQLESGAPGVSVNCFPLDRY